MLGKLRYRFQYNSWLRLIINALKRVGITILPYYVFRRTVSTAPKPPLLKNMEFAELSADDMAHIAGLPLVHGSEATYFKRLAEGQRVFGLRQAGEVVAFCWFDPDCFSFPGEGDGLRPEEVYIYDIYTRPDRRGQGIAPLLNACYTKSMHDEGFRDFLGVIDSLNRPSISYVRKVGSQAERKSLYLNLFGIVEKTYLLATNPEQAGLT